ncbi:MAG: hypothetical protein ACD_23C00276G0001 [uncultured bacterium]|nr:MAG: hypothetical protein ACD_23C00276G0001 [uncultured bacterium]
MVNHGKLVQVAHDDLITYHPRAYRRETRAKDHDLMLAPCRHEAQHHDGKHAENELGKA